MELMDALGFSTRAEFDAFEMRFNLVNFQDFTLPNRVAIANYLISNPEEKGPFGANLVFEIIEYLFETLDRAHIPRSTQKRFHDLQYR